MRKLHFLNSDNYHIKPKNMPSLFGFMKEYGIKAETAPPLPELERCFGDYRNKGAVLDDIIKQLLNLDKEQIWNYSYIGKKLFPLVYRELLVFGIKHLIWPDEYIKNDLRFLFDFFYDNAKADLLLNYAVGIKWLQHWREFFRTRRDFTHCFVYSASDIKTSALIEFIRIHGASPVILETFYTGTHYYMEHSYESIPNRSALRFPNLYKARLKKKSVSHLEQKNTIKICRNINSTFSKINVEYDAIDIQMDSSKKTLLILGQVCDDYSIINSGMDNMSSIHFYKKIIARFMTQTDCNIIFKAHPWERVKLSSRNLKSTYKHIAEYCADTFSDQMERIAIIEKYPLPPLFRKVDWVLAINSQSILEAAFAGFKGMVFGNPFYGCKGFTWDCGDIDECISSIKNGDMPGKLTIEEFEKFEEFMVVAFRHLMPKDRMHFDELWTRLPECDEEIIACHHELRRLAGLSKNQTMLEILLAYSTRLSNAFKRFRKDPYGYLGNNRRRYFHPFRHIFFWTQFKQK